MSCDNEQASEWACCTGKNASYITRCFAAQAPVVQRLDNAIHWINHYPADSMVCFVNAYPLDSDSRNDVVTKGKLELFGVYLPRD